MPHILELCLFINPETWNVDSSLKQTHFKNPGSKSTLCSIVTANFFRRGLSSDLKACSNYTLLYRPTHKIENFNRLSRASGICHSHRFNFF